MIISFNWISPIILTESNDLNVIWPKNEQKMIVNIVVNVILTFQFFRLNFLGLHLVPIVSQNYSNMDPITKINHSNNSLSVVFHKISLRYKKFLLLSPKMGKICHIFGILISFDTFLLILGPFLLYLHIILNILCS